MLHWLAGRRVDFFPKARRQLMETYHAIGMEVTMNVDSLLFSVHCPSPRLRGGSGAVASPLKPRRRLCSLTSVPFPIDCGRNRSKYVA